MLRFLSKIRRSYSGQGQFRKYLLYAIGEILLLVIGIIIALQVNNWNESRKLNRKAGDVINNLHHEFMVNQDILKDLFDKFEKSKNSNFRLMEFMGNDVSTIPQKKMDSLAYWSIEHRPFNPSNNTFEEILQSGNLALIKDSELKRLLFSWSHEMENYQSTYHIYELFLENQLITFMIDYIAFRNIDTYGQIQWKSGSSYSSDYTEIFQSRKFENIIDNNLYHLMLLDDHYKTLRDIILKILEKTDNDQ